jgi:hypothetical protein
VRAVVSGMDLFEDDLCLSAWNREHRIFCPRRMQTTIITLKPLLTQWDTSVQSSL